MLHFLRKIYTLTGDQNFDSNHIAILVEICYYTGRNLICIDRFTMPKFYIKRIGLGVIRNFHVCQYLSILLVR